MSLKTDQIFRIRLAVVEDDKHAGIGHSVHDAVVLLSGGGALGRRYDHALLPNGEVPRQHSTEVHALLTVLVGWGVGVAGRVVSCNCKVGAIAVTSS